MKPPTQHWLKDGVIAGVIAGILSGIPSMSHALFVGYLSPWEPLLAAGSIVAGADASTGRLIVAGIIVHGTLSLFWALVLALILPRLPLRSIIRWGGLAGALIAVIDLRLIGPSFVRIAALPLIPQLLDHIAFGAIVAIVIRARLFQRSASDE